MENSECTCKEDSIEKCDIFDFMAKYVGMSILHPGGFVSTNRLLNSLNLSKYKRILDIACGKGTTSILIAKKFGCKITGIDISPVFIEDAKKLAKKMESKTLLTFR